MKNYFSLVTLLIYAALMLITIFIIPYGEEVIYINQNTSKEFKQFFYYITYFGEWIGIVILALILIIRKDIKGLVYAAVGYLPTMLTMQSFKSLVYAPRPLSSSISSYIEPLEGVRPLYWRSMPSGHTFNAFFLATFIVFYFKMNRALQFGIILLAILVGWSRIVLTHHFKEDVLAGSLLGIIGGLLPFLIFSYVKHEPRWMR